MIKQKHLTDRGWSNTGYYIWSKEEHKGIEISWKGMFIKVLVEKYKVYDGVVETEEQLDELLKDQNIE